MKIDDKTVIFKKMFAFMIFFSVLHVNENFPKFENLNLVSMVYVIFLNNG